MSRGSYYREALPGERKCSVENCNMIHQAKGLCKRHYKNYCYSSSLYKCKDATLSYKKLPKSKFSKLKETAKRKNHTFELSFDEFCKFQTMPCYYCGLLNNSNYGYGIDRIDNKIGYLYANCVSCCWACNKIKCDILTKEEMLVAMKAVLELRAKK